MRGLCLSDCVEVPVWCRETLLVHGLHVESSDDLGADTAHTVLLYSEYCD